MKAEMPAVVTCVGLTKVYQTGLVALNDLTLTIEPGMSFGLMGENGAGKSTLVKLLMGFIFPTSGQLSIFGEKEVRRAHSRVSVIFTSVPMLSCVLLLVTTYTNCCTSLANSNKTKTYPLSLLNCCCSLLYQSNL
jgi:ABC-type uncharacterized transport system ATPase subunit